MTAAYRLKGAGWLIVGVAVVLGFYLVSLRVAAERKRLEQVDARIAQARRDIRALETEFDTRANLAQLERWNGDTLGFAAPTAAQFVPSGAALAAIDAAAPAPGAPGVAKTAALVVPAAVVPAALPTEVLAAAPVPAAPAVARVAAKAESGFVRIAAMPAAAGRTLARLADAGGATAIARPRTVAMLDGKLLSDSTLGDLLASARREARPR